MDRGKIIGFFAIMCFGIIFFISVTVFILSLFAGLFVLSIVSVIIVIALYFSKEKVTRIVRKRVVNK